jgi:hypothetical protein
MSDQPGTGTTGDDLVTSMATDDAVLEETAALDGDAESPTVDRPPPGSEPEQRSTGENHRPGTLRGGARVVYVDGGADAEAEHERPELPPRSSEGTSTEGMGA